MVNTDNHAQQPPPAQNGNTGSFEMGRPGDRHASTSLNEDLAVFRALLDSPESLSGMLPGTAAPTGQPQGPVTGGGETMTATLNTTSLSANNPGPATAHPILMAERNALANMGARLAQKLREHADSDQALVFSLDGADNQPILVSARQDQNARWQVALTVSGDSLRQELQQATPELADRIRQSLGADVAVMVAVH